jgi:endonuclease/exonuclease/phosphatase family metal-dependent hydrolase
MIKILTMNLNYYVTRFGAWGLRRELVGGAVREAQPDLLAFQAVRLDPEVAGGQDQAAQLARLLGYPHIYFQPALVNPDGSAEGSALAARLPWREVRSCALTRLEGGEDSFERVLLTAVFDLPGEPLTLFNAHFSWVGEQAELNLREALSFMAEFAGPALLVGDLNNPPGCELWALLKQVGWVDAWSRLRPGEAGFTFVEGDRLAKRIDYAWANRELAPYLQAIEVVAERPLLSGERASDHAGLLVTLGID